MTKHLSKQGDDKKPELVSVSLKPTKHRLLKSLLASAALVGALGSCYAIGTTYFSTRFSPGTIVNGQDVSFMTEAEVAKLIDERATSYSNTVSNGDFSVTLTADEMGLECNGTTCAHEAFASTDPMLWLSGLFSPRTITVKEAVTYDEEKVTQAVTDAVKAYNRGAKSPKNAYVSYNDESKSWEVKSAEQGTKLKVASVVECALASVDSQNEATEIDETALVQPKIDETNSELTETVDKANKLLDQEIAVKVGDEEKARVSRDQLAGWVKVEDDNSVKLDEGAVRQWTQDTLSEPSTFSDDKYDYSLNLDATVSSLTNSIEQANGSEINAELVATEKVVEPEPEPEDENANSSASGWDSNLGRYIDVNLTSQYARLFDAKGGVLWESYIVSGNTADSKGTPTGTYNVYSKETNVDLVGLDENGDGKPDYTSHVNYWMPFMGGYGLHDAMWRYEFGGDLYQYEGSHGCVNLPSDAAASLYSLINVGELVSIHW